MSGISILATGSYLPPTAMANRVFERTLDTSDEWIRTRTGIKSRRFAREEGSAEMAARAAKQALARAGIAPEQLCCLILTTFTPDFLAPAEACRVQKLLGLPETLLAFDLNAACSGFVFGLQTVKGILLQHPGKAALLVSVEKMSSYLDFSDRSTCVLFGDGAAAAVIALREGGEDFYEAGVCGCQEALSCSAHPGGKLRMDGPAVYRFAIEKLPKTIAALAARAGISPGMIDHLVCHQANARILAQAAKKLGLSPERFYQNLEELGNTSSASIPLALDEMNEKGLLHRGDRILCVGFGAGLTWGGALFQW